MDNALIFRIFVLFVKNVSDIAGMVLVVSLCSYMRWPLFVSVESRI